MNMSNQGGMTMDMTGMRMYFHTGYEEYILFENAKTTTKGEFAGACIIVIIFGVLYEMLKQLREELYSRQTIRQAVLAHCAPEEKGNSNSNSNTNNTNNNSLMRQIISYWHLTQTLLHLVQMFMSYCMMLVFMTYNAYLAICILIGLALGYLIVGWKRTSSLSLSAGQQNEHCH